MFNNDFDIGVDISELQEAYKNATEYKFKSRFSFLREVNGLRPNCISCLLGITSAGKSTLLKAIIADIIQEHKALIWLTEEERSQYSIQIINASTEKLDSDKRSNMVFFQEGKRMEELKKIRKPSDASAYIIDKIILSGCDVVVFDNMTTSSLYDKFTPQGQAEIAQDIRAFIESSGKAFLYLAHTQKGINKSVNRLLGSEDIQGSSMLAKVSQYFFVLQTFDIGNSRHSYITTTKHRQHAEVKHTYFMLKFEHGRYSGDIICDFEQIANSFGARNRFKETSNWKSNEKNQRKF